MNSDTTNIIRSAAFLLCALPITVSLANRLNVGTDVVRKQIEVTPAQQAVIDLKNDLTKICIDYKLSKADTKLERQAKNDIDEVFDGEVLYNVTCNYVLG
jgi:hypothetical protein